MHHRHSFRRLCQWSVPYLLLTSLLLPGNTAADPLAVLAKMPTYMDVKLSPDGNRIAARVRVDEGIGVITLDASTMTVLAWMKPTRFEAAGLHWANSERLVIEIGLDQARQEQLTSYGELYAVDFDGTDGDFIYGIRSSDGRSGSRTSNRASQLAWAVVIDPLPLDDKHILISSEPISRTGNAIPDVVRLNVETGRTRDLYRAPVEKARFLTDENHEPRIATGINEDNQTKAFYRPGKGREWLPIPAIDDYFFTPVTVNEGSKTLTFVGRYGSDLAGLYRMDLETMQAELIYAHDVVDISDVELSADRQQVLAARIDPGHSSYLILDTDHPQSADFRSLLDFFAGLRVSLLSQSIDARRAIVGVDSDIYPGLIYLWDGEKPGLLFKVFPDIDETTLTQVQPVSFSARDETSLHGYLTRTGNQPGPTVILVHGGPHFVRDYWTFDPEVQMLAAMGVNVLQVNFRGSGGYGAKFGEAGYGEWGRGIQHDIIDATRWAVSEGVADPERVCIMGTSFGAYSAVQSAILAPDDFKCAVAVAGIYDLPMLYKRGDIQESYFGESYLDLVLGTDPALLDAFSPVNHTDKLKAPLLIVHGVEDQRAPVSHARNLIKALSSNEKPHEAHIETSEGHGFTSDKNRLTYFRLVKAFLTRELALTP